MSSFPQADATQLLADCRRCCCICHRFCGVKIELDHMTPRSEGGSDEIENAIPVCFECHAEIHSYNEEHPRGRKFRAEELRRHKENWLSLVRSRPEILLSARSSQGVGPLQSLVDELEFNAEVAKARGVGTAGCPFLVTQFERAIETGSIAVLVPDLKQVLLTAYRAMLKANNVMPAAALGDPIKDATHRANKLLQEAEPLVGTAKEELLRFLGHAEA